MRCGWSCWVTVLGLASCVAAAGPSAPELRANALDGDPRLDTRLTVRVPGVSLRELLPRLSEVTGVGLTAAPEVAEQKVVLFGPARPARNALGDLAALLDLRWERMDKNGAAVYRLSRSLQSAQREAALRAAVAKRLQEIVDEHARALSETEEQLNRRPERDITRSILSDPDFRPATVFYSLLSSRQKDELFTRKRLLLPLAALAPQLQAPLRQVYSQRVDREDTFFNSPEGQEAIQKAGPGGRIIRHRLDDLERNAFRIESLRADGFMSVGMNLGAGPTSLSDDVDENGRHSFSTNGWPVTLVDTARLWLLPPHGSPYEPADLDGDTVRSFARAAGEPGNSRDWIDRLRTLAEKSGKPVLADYFRGALANHAPMDTPDAGLEKPDERALDRFCAENQYLWWTRGSSLFLRKRDWYAQADYEVPDSWFVRVAAGLAARSGKVAAEDVAQASELTVDQVSGLAALGRGSWVRDSTEGEAFHELVALASSRLRGRDTPIPLSERPGDAPPLVFGLGDLAPAQQRSIRQLGSMLGWILTPEELQAFRTEITARAPKTTGDFRYTPVYFRCSFGPAHQMADTINLPLAVPHDRRRELTVERAR